MANKIEIKRDYIYIKITGQLSLKDKKDMDEVQNSLVDVLSVAREKNLPKLLFDGREVTGTLSTIERFSIMEFLAGENISQFIDKGILLKIAFVLSPKMESSKFGETVGRNRGLNTLVTNDIQEAYKWLGTTRHN